MAQPHDPRFPNATAEMEVMGLERRYQVLFQNVLHGLVVQDATGMIISSNPAAERILGLSTDQLQGRFSTDPRWHAIHEDGSAFPGETHPAMVALRTGRPVEGVVMGVSQPGGGDAHWISVAAAPLFLPGAAQPFQVVTTFEDITERRRSEAAQLALAQQLACLGGLAGEVAQNLDRLLGSIHSLATAHQEGHAPDSPARQAFATIVTAAERGASQVAGLLQRLAEVQLP
jgi:PAS domain S-box-containing protein